MATWTLLVWCAVGVAISVVLAKQQRTSPRWTQALRVPLHVLLWPLFLPTLLPETGDARTPPRTSWDARIESAEATLSDALRALGRDLDDPLALERVRVASLGRALRSAAARLTDIDTALALPMHDVQRIRVELQAAQISAEGAPVVEVLRRRLSHVERLEAIGRQARLDLERALAEAVALASRLTLLRYEDGRAGTAAGRARELTDTVDALCEVLAEARTAPEEPATEAVPPVSVSRH